MRIPTLLLLLTAGAAAQERLLHAFAGAADLGPAQARGVRLAGATAGGKGALAVEFLPGEWPNVAFPGGDWRGFDGLALDLVNPGTEAVAFGVRADDDPHADGARFCRQGSGTVGPGEALACVLPLGPDPMTFGMRGLPAAGGLQPLGLHDAGPLRLERITAFQIFLHRPPRPTTLLLVRARLVRWRLPLEGIVDSLGQFAGAEWPGKARGAGDFAGRRRAEEAALDAAAPPAGRDEYGGWIGGPILEATGRFRTGKVGGRWWLVTPGGRLFLSLGACCIHPGQTTLVTGRERMFAWLPAPDQPLARHFSRLEGVRLGPVREGMGFDFLAANLERKYGEDYIDPWLETSRRRLAAWGFNTVANWSDRRLWPGGRLAYVATAGIGGGHARIPSDHEGGAGMHDPFDPGFPADVDAALTGTAALVRDDPWCLGWFVDNELDWGGGRCGLGLRALALAADRSPAKRTLLADLRRKYATPGDLAEAWGTPVSTWEGLAAPWRPAGQPTTARTADLRAFAGRLAAAYFDAVRAALARLAPGRLYLGCRFAGHTPEAVAAAAAHCDVLSFNIYAKRVERAAYAFLEELDRPAMVGEFHFGALDRGLFHPGLVAASDQNGRAALYREYVESVLDHPCLVGCHWFQWYDEPLTGRWFDGENYNIGFLTVTDDPYPELVAAARSVHGKAYDRRWGAGVEGR